MFEHIKIFFCDKRWKDMELQLYHHQYHSTEVLYESDYKSP